MPWPFMLRATHLDVLTPLKVELAELRARVVAADARADTYQRYYEALADDTLMKRGEASGPVHTTPADRTDPMTRTIGRAFGLVGNARGAPLTGPRDAATRPAR